MKNLFISLICFAFLIKCSNYETNNSDTISNQSEKSIPMETKTIYDYSYKTPAGELKQISQFEGNVILAVNTATQCGLTPQFEGLEELHNTFGDKGLKVIGFPCNQFGGQEPLSNEEMVETCKINHGVTFELTQKIDVNGENVHPIYSFLKSEQPIEEDNNIRWNFEKFLIDKNGKVVKRFSPQTTPEELTSEIEKLL